jgi:mannose-6-phosphate isomerase-like protein (cupin superfamily)
MAKAKKHASSKSSPKISPLLRSAFEVLNHGLWHFFRSDTSTDMKFALLHVDQAVELVLKECVRSSGRSIYRNPKETITIWGAYDALAELNIAIPEKPDLELLHEERNSIQHKFANPSAEDTAFHVHKAVKFIRRFLKGELKIDVKDYVSAEYLDQIP